MNIEFEFYLIHPSTVINSNQVELVKFLEEVLRNNRSSSIILENTDNFLSSNVLMKKYSEFLNNVKSYTVRYRENIYLISGESVYACARRFIRKKKSICFIGFPYQELRALYTLIAENNSFVIKYAVLDFNERRKTEGINLAKSDGKMGLDLSKISIDYKPVQDLEDLACKENFFQIVAYEDAMTPSSFIYTFNMGKNRMIMKSAAVLTPDYIMKVEDLIELRKLFVEDKKIEAMPQRIVYDSKTARGVVFNYIDGPSLEKLYHDTFYKHFMEKNHFESSIANRVYLLIQLLATICEYHSLGIYFSDIKGDNFIVTNDCRVVPIDTDGFSYYKYYSSCPRPEMLYCPEKDHKRIYLQNIEAERFSIMAMVYCFLMDGNFPVQKKNKFSLKNINDDPGSIIDTERGKNLAERWAKYPEYIREVLYDGLVKNKSYCIESLLTIFVRYYTEIVGISVPELKIWLERKVSINELNSAWKTNAIKLFDYIKIEKKSVSFKTEKQSIEDIDYEDWYNIFINEEPNREEVNPDMKPDNTNTVRKASDISATGSCFQEASKTDTGGGKKKKKSKKGLFILLIILAIAAIIGLYFANQNGMFNKIRRYFTVSGVETCDILASNAEISEKYTEGEDVTMKEGITSVVIGLYQSKSITVDSNGNIPDTISYSEGGDDCVSIPLANI